MLIISIEANFVQVWDHRTRRRAVSTVEASSMQEFQCQVGLKDAVHSIFL